MTLVIAGLTVVGLLLRMAGAAADDGAHVIISDLDASAFPELRMIATVVDSNGKPVRGLHAGDLSVTEGGTRQDATIQLASETTPAAVALVLDTSGSMAGRPLADAKQAMIGLLDALGPRDQAAILTFDVNVRVEQALTGDRAALVAATNRASASGNTAIYDALAAATAVLDAAPANARRTLILMTDGIDNSSRATAGPVLAGLARSRIVTQVIGLGSDLDRAALQAIAAGGAPGGQLAEAPTSARLAAIYASLGEQLVTQYSIAYRSAAQVPDGTLLSIGLAVRQAGVQIASGEASFAVPSGHGLPRQASAPPATAAPPAAVAEVVAAPRPVRSGTSPELVGLLGAAAVLTLLLWIAELATHHPGRQRQRLEIFVRGLSLTSPEHSKRRSIVQRIVVPTLRSAGRPLLRITPTGVIGSTRDRLQAAGEPMGLGPSEFLGVRAGAGMIGMIAGAALVTRFTGDPGAVPPSLFGGLLLGYAVPAFVVDSLARRRKAAIRRALPAALDMLALSAEAGLSFDGAIGQVAHRWDTPLSDELRRVLVEFQMGRERREALRELARRTGVVELSRFAGAVIQADSLGVPLSRVLHEQSTEIRIRRRQRAEELAHKAPVKMLFPMVALIFPALFVVILGPAIPRLLQAFSAFQ